jgi:hypothetical protein
MVAIHLKNTRRFAGFDSNSNPNVKRLAGRVGHFFDRHPEVARQEFLLDAVQREIDFCERQETKRGAEKQHSTARPTLNAADVNRQAELAARLAAMHYQRHGLWPRLRRFLLG